LLSAADQVRILADTAGALSGDLNWASASGTPI